MRCSRWFSPVGLDPVEKECPFCRSDDRLPVAQLQAEPEIQMLRCRSCAAVSASPLPASEVLQRHYEGYARFYNRYSDGHRTTFSRVPAFARHVMKKILPLPNASRMNILDFGGGDGSMSLELARRFFLAAASYPSKAPWYVFGYRYKLVGGWEVFARKEH
jgi:hypothetical protein